MSDKSYTPPSEFTYKNYPVIDFRNETDIRCDISVAANIFPDECKWWMQPVSIICRLKKWQMIDTGYC